MAPDGLTVHALGRLEITNGQRTLGPADLGGRKPNQVFGILPLHQGQPVAKERLADLLWANELPKDPNRTLEAYVSVLRSRLGPMLPDVRQVLRTESAGYRLTPDGLDLDTVEFDRLVAAAAAAPAGDRRALREQALALCRGDLLADEPYAEWVLPLRHLYAERLLVLLLDLAEDCLSEGLNEDAARHAEAVLADQPTRERAHRTLMLAQYAAGDQDLALQSRQRCRRVLDDELGVRPLAATQRVFETVLHHRPPPVSRRPVATAAVRAPEVRFARHDGATIAYQVIGSGSTDLVFAHAWFSHMEVGWEDPHYRRFLAGLAHGRRLLIFDRRGMGMSDPAPPEVTSAERADDIRAVMDAAGSERAVLIGSCGSGPPVMSLAARAPDRVSGLVLFGTFARMLACADYPMGWSRPFFEQYKAGLELGWSTGRGVFRSVPSAGGDERLMEWLGRLLRLSASPGAARAILEFGATLDVRDLLGRIRAPALVLHRRDDQWISPDNGRYLAEHIPDARFVLLEGADHWPWFGDAESVLDAVEEFLPLTRGFSEGRRPIMVP